MSVSEEVLMPNPVSPTIAPRASEWCLGGGTALMLPAPASIA